MSCLTNDDCSFLYSCVSSKCIHNTVFPLQSVPIIIYILMPFCSGLVNTTGNSMGVFKVLFVLLILKYTGSQATMITQSMVVGASLSNFFSIINRRHPIIETSLVNYNLVYVLIPCSLLGSTFGSLIGKFLPQIIQDVLIIIFFGYFAYNFFRKYRQAQQKQDEIEINANAVHPLPQINDNIQANSHTQIKITRNRQADQYYSEVGAQIEAYQSVQDVAERAQKNIQAPKINLPQLKITNQKKKKSNQESTLAIVNESVHKINIEPPSKQQQQVSNKNETNPQQRKNQVPSSQGPKNTTSSNQNTPVIVTSQNNAIKFSLEEQKQKEVWIQYQKSNHVFDILMSIGVFFVFEFIVFLVQGKLPFLKFNNCDTKYIVGIILLAIITLVYIYFVRFYLKKRFQRYQKYQIKQEGDLGSFSQYIMAILGGFFAGFVQGGLGIGSGIFIMAVTMSLPITPASASATSGYQILFIGAASLVQGFINGDVRIVDTFFIIGICAVFGGAITLAITWYLKDKNHVKVSKILTFIIFLLCLMSFILVIPSAVITAQQNGWTSMIEEKFSCKSS